MILKFITGAILSFLVFLNLFQTYQYHFLILHPDRMTKEAYALNFLSYHGHVETASLLIKAHDESGIEKLDSTANYQRRIIGLEDMEFGRDDSYVSDTVFEGKHAQRVPPSGFSKVLWIPFNATTTEDYAFLKVSARVFIPSSSDTITKAILYGQMEYKGKGYFWKALQFENLKLLKDQWQLVEFIYLTPEVRTREDIFKTCIWNTGKTPIYIDNLMIESYYK